MYINLLTVRIERQMWNASVLSIDLTKLKRRGSLIALGCYKGNWWWDLFWYRLLKAPTVVTVSWEAEVDNIQWAFDRD